ncbi:amidohydrolase [Pseudonocardia thermophila]|uniref:Amidohydrolase n=1 Tax=Pseudonocardia thermophila TaxID=1848 RepID=A0A1M6TQL0_PSETH|nr:M20 family metallopeptidase [Pseudonocardia thermophila]SHK59226.1 amidohydrolase [Pseudonocardia thermophila]
MTLLDAHTDLAVPGAASVTDLGEGSGPAWLDAWLSAHRDDVVAWRRTVHAHPELGRAEHRTTALVARELMAAGLEPRTLPGGTGLVCDVGYGDRCVALRADLDALPLQEATGLPFASTVPDVMHACGHDAHTAMLLGAGLALASAPALPGRVRLIFQPAEEVQPGGAIDMVADGALEGVERIFALHCDPRLEVGKLGTRVGPITSACDIVEVALTSPGGHTARPHLTADLVEAVGSLITQLPLLLTRQVDPRSGTVLVWGAVQAGEAPNAIPQRGVLRGTLRTADRHTWGELEGRVRAIVETVLAPYGVGYELSYTRGVPPVVNDERSARMLADAAVAILGPDASTGTEQSSGGEDFAWYLEQVPGAMARLGVWPGEGAPMKDIHQPTFDLDERALPVGVRVLANVALAALTD